jgi:hypothetical protein
MPVLLVLLALAGVALSRMSLLYRFILSLHLKLIISLDFPFEALSESE